MKKFTFFLKFFVLGLIFFFISKYIYINFSLINFKEISFNIFFLILSIIVYVLHVFLNVYVWHIITRQNNCNISLIETFKVRVYSDFGKYIPGKLFAYGILFYHYEKKNISKKKIIICSLQESIVSILAPGIISLICMFFLDIKELSIYKTSVILLLVFCMIIIHPKLINYFINIFFTLFKKDKVEITSNYFQILVVLLWSILSWLIYGWSFYFFINSFYHCELNTYFFLTGAFAISTLFGFLAFFTPGGLGVREGVLMYLMSFSFPISIATLVSLLSRIWSIIIELIILFIIYFINYIIKYTQNKKF